ncbi:MAG: hypothetical protein ACLQBX_12680, partial [Candidatus Limnocylindrales bacterium]
MLSGAQPTCFLIADISGYTGYLADVELDHAQDILADLTGAVVTALRPNFRLAKLEGDAAFTFATAEKIDGSMLLDTIERLPAGEAVVQGELARDVADAPVDGHRVRARLDPEDQRAPTR